MARLYSERGKSSKFRVDEALPFTLVGGTGGRMAGLVVFGAAATEGSFASSLPISRAAESGGKALMRANSAGLFASWYMIAGPCSLVNKAWVTASDTGTSEADMMTSSKSGLAARTSAVRR